MTDKTIADPHPLILNFREDWSRTRHVIEGGRAVRRNARDYIPQLSGQDNSDYDAYIKRITFYPGASRTHDGLLGLMFRKAATVTCPDGVRDILDTITVQGYSIDDLAEEVASEALITNFVGLMVDYPIATDTLTVADAIAGGFRPFVGVYKAESILWVEVGIVGNRQRFTRVVLQDCEDTIRECILDQGVYSVTEHKLINNQWQVVANFTPLRKGVPLDEIPFTLVTTRRHHLPTKSPLADVADLNIQHYLASANLSTCMYYASSPIHVICGAENNPALSVAPGAKWTFRDSSARAEILEFEGKAVGALRDVVKDIEGHMAQVGSRILAAEKAEAEAAETLAIRRASENATLASVSRIVSRKITEALAWVAWWMDMAEDTFSYEMNTDYNATTLSGPEILARLSLYQNDTISLDAFLDMMMDSEVLPETFDKDADRELREQEMDARPPMTAEPSPVTGLPPQTVGEKPAVAITPPPT